MCFEILHVLLDALYFLAYLCALCSEKQNTMTEGNITIHVKDNESIDRALKRFKKKFEQTRVLRKLRSKMYYKKPSIQRREERIKAIYKQKMFGNQ